MKSAEKGKKQKWFKAKTYGYGWYPSTWQGWAVTGIFLFLIALTVAIFQFLIFKFPEAARFVWIYVIIIFLLSGILTYIAYKKGEKARWRWGNRPKQQKK